MAPHFFMAIHTVIGPIRSGKTTICAMLAHKAIKQGKKVYTNVPEIDGIQLTLQDFGKIAISSTLPPEYKKENAILIFDECGIALAGRDCVRKVPKPFLDWLRTSGHDKVDCWFFSQASDIDPTIKRLSFEMWYLKKWLVLPVTTMQRWHVKPFNDEIQHDLVIGWAPNFWFPFLTRKWVWRPRWYKHFNSWRSDTDLLPKHPAEMEWVKSHLRPRAHFKCPPAEKSSLTLTH